MKRLRPFFSYFGAKFTLAPKYPEPAHKLIVEPFAGSAQYSLLHHGRDVLLCDADPVVCGVWDYLLRASEAEILALPLLEDAPLGFDLGALPVPQEARDLIGFWTGKALCSPCRKVGAWFVRWRQSGQSHVWSREVRARIASQLRHVRHWRVRQCSYVEIEDLEATWFVDPPYQAQGVRYVHGARALDYGRLGAWCRARRGLAIVCEAKGADWLPFCDLAQGRTARLGGISEVSWVSSASRQMSLF